VDATGNGSGTARRSVGWRGAAVIAITVALVTTGCQAGTITPAPMAPGGSQATPTSAPPSASPSLDVAPSLDLSVVQDLLAPVASVTTSEDGASPFAAIVEFGPNKADLARIELYRGTDGSIGTVVGYDAAGRSVALFLNEDGRPVGAIADDETRFEVRYPSGAVEVSVVYPDGTTDRETVSPKAGVASPIARTPVRLAAWNPVTSRVDYPRQVYTTGFVRVETTRPNGKPVPPDSVRYADATCVSTDPDVTCIAWIGILRTLGEVGVTSIVTVPAALQGSGQIWRTRADCDENKSWTALNFKLGGTMFASAVLAFGIIRGRASPVWRGQTTTLAAAVMYGSYAVGQGLSWIPWFAAEDCATVPNLEAIRDAVLDAKVESTLAVSVRAEPTTACEPPSKDGLRIRQPVGKIQVEPFVRKLRSSTPEYHEDGDYSQPTRLGSIGLRASACPIEMTGEIDIASVATSMGATESSLAEFSKMVAENRVSLTIEEADDPAEAATATGDFVLSIVLPASAMWSLHESAVDAVGEGFGGGGSSPRPMPPEWVGCDITSRIAGTMEGGYVVVDGVHIADGRAVGDVTQSLPPGCEVTVLKVDPPKKLGKVTWAVKGDATKMRGELAILFPEDGTEMVWKFEVRAK